MKTEDAEYATRLLTKETAWWKQFLNVQAPYQWNLRRYQLGRTLDIGCGVGRNLASLSPTSVGVDHNPQCIAVAVRRGYQAMTVGDFFASDLAQPEGFESMLVAHVLEHMSGNEGKDLLRTYLPLLKPGGRVLLICPQERGYASDPTHVRWTTGEDLANLCVDVGLHPNPWASFPLPRAFGNVFKYNEFNLLARKAESTDK